MSFQTQKLNIRLPHQDKSIDKVFKNLTTAKLAKVLVDMIIRYEEPANYDECIEAIWTDLFKKIDDKASFPVSDFVASEIAIKIADRSNSRFYRVSHN